MVNRWMVRSVTAVTVGGLCTLAYTVGDAAETRSITDGTIAGVNAMLDPASGLLFNFLPAVQLGATGILHVDALQHEGLIQRIDVSDVADSGRPTLPHLRVLLLPAVRETSSSVEVHFFDSTPRDGSYGGPLKIFITDGTTTVPGELVPAVIPTDQ